jgi:hypothetical protein
MPEAVIPMPDPVPLPAPVWLFEILLVTTFILHIVSMNMLLGGGVIALAARLRARRNPQLLKLSGDLVRILPSFFAATITLGIAPLLFVQTLYGQFFYSSSVLLGWYWFAVLVLIVLAYYGLYLGAFRVEAKSNTLIPILAASVAFILLVGFIYSNNFSLMLSPSNWLAKYHADPRGLNLNLEEASLFPRYLHFMTASLSIGGLMVAIFGMFRWSKDKVYGLFMMRHGATWFLSATLAQFAVGIWFFLSLPRDILGRLLGEDLPALGVLLVGILLAVTGVVTILAVFGRPDPRRTVLTAVGLMAGVLLTMAWMRDWLRKAYLSDFFQVRELASRTQWDVLLLFLVLFAGAILLWAVMIKRFFFAPERNAEEAKG